MSPVLRSRMLACCLLLAGPLCPAGPPAADKKSGGASAIGNFMVQLDNDLFTGDDSDYTNGFRAAMGGELGTQPDYDRLREVLRRFSGDESTFGFLDKLYGINSRELTYGWGFGVTQQMYTPDKPRSVTPLPGERPYAAWMAMEFSMQVRGEDSLSSVGLAVGVTGEWALGEEMQDIVHHDLTGSDLFNGWGSQLPNEVTLGLLLDQKRRIRPLADLEWGKFGLDGYTEFQVTSNVSADDAENRDAAAAIARALLAACE